MNTKLIYSISAVIVGCALLAALFFFSPLVKYYFLTSGTPIGKVLARTIGSNDIDQRYNLSNYFLEDLKHYDPDKSEKLLLKNLESQEHEPSLFELTRVYFSVENRKDDMQLVIDTADKYLDLYPDKKRMHYIRGLARAYINRDSFSLEEDMAGAVEDFRTFIEFAPDEWAGYLDLSWVYFMSGQLVQSREVIETGYDIDPDNPWLSSAYGVVLANQGEEEEALFILGQALDQAKSLSREEWRASYTSSNPNNIDSEMSEFLKVIEYNIQLVEDRQSVSFEQIREVAGVDFANPSIKGLGYGLHVSACRSSCPACNICGDCNVHRSHSSGNGPQCSPPALPATYGDVCQSTPNACGIRKSGTRVCDGSCNPTDPDAATEVGDDFVRIANNQTQYIYKGTQLASNGLSTRCHTFTNESGRAIFVPLKTENEFVRFINSTEISSNPGFGIQDVTP